MTACVETFKVNKVNSKGTFDFTTADEDTAILLYDRDFSTQITSVASADGTNEKIKVTFQTAQTINAVAIMNHNIKKGNIKYLNSGGSEVDFSSAISWSGNTTETYNYYEFDEVTAYGLVVNCTHTIDAGQKRIGQLIGLERIASFDSPARFMPSYGIEAVNNTKADGGIDKIIKGVKHKGQIKFDNLDDTDLDNLFELAQYSEPFWIYLSKLSTDKAKRFFRVQDIFLVNMTNEPNPMLPDGLVDDIGWIDSLEFAEV
jgi:VCBS repeat-containing protein